MDSLEKEKKNGHGGARRGAGRKGVEGGAHVWFTASAEAAAVLAGIPKRERSAWISAAIVAATDVDATAMDVAGD